MAHRTATVAALLARAVVVMAMPQDFTGDEVGAPILCPHCRAVIDNLSEKDHVTDRESERAAIQLSRQCCQWRLR